MSCMRKSFEKLLDKVFGVLFFTILIGAVANLIIFFIIGCIVVNKLCIGVITVSGL